jgi:hypothetical protein
MYQPEEYVAIYQEIEFRVFKTKHGKYYVKFEDFEKFPQWFSMQVRTNKAEYIIPLESPYVNNYDYGEYLENIIWEYFPKTFENLINKKFEQVMQHITFVRILEGKE